MPTRTNKLLAAAFPLLLIAAACGSDDTDDAATTTAPATEETEAAASDTTAAGDEVAAGTIVDVASGDPQFSTLVAAVTAAGLGETLSGDGPFTVFAPTNDAFDAAFKALGITAEELLADEEKLKAILTYHVVAGEVPSSEVVKLDGKSAETVNGAEVAISLDGDTVMVNEAKVIAVDVKASNGVIHVIDSVLLPPS